MRRAGSPAQPGRRNHDGVASLLTRAAQSSAGAYLLVDPFLATWRQARDRLRIPVSNDVTVVKVGYAGITDDHCPHLIRWKSTDDTWLRHSMMLADEEQADGGQESVKGLMISGWLFPMRHPPPSPTILPGFPRCAIRKRAGVICGGRIDGCWSGCGPVFPPVSVADCWARSTPGTP